MVSELYFEVVKYRMAKEISKRRKDGYDRPPSQNPPKPPTAEHISQGIIC
jgi:hypothetical protein